MYGSSGCDGSAREVWSSRPVNGVARGGGTELAGMLTTTTRGAVTEDNDDREGGRMECGVESLHCGFHFRSESHTVVEYVLSRTLKSKSIEFQSSHNSNWFLIETQGDGCNN